MMVHRVAALPPSCAHPLPVAQTNGVIERFFESIKYEHLYREEIQSGAHLADEARAYLDLYNNVRPHEFLAVLTPMEVYLRPPEV